jgi:hypothetical protein
VAAHRVVSLERPAGSFTTAFVGRDDELRRLTAVYDAAVAAPARAGGDLGRRGSKSRHPRLTRRLGGQAIVLTAPCAAGGGTFTALAEAVRTLLGVEDTVGEEAVRQAVAARVGGDEPEGVRIAGGVAALLAGAPRSPEETFFAVRRFLAALAVTQPVVLALDDLQWAEPLLLDLAEHLVQWSTGVPLLVLIGVPAPRIRASRRPGPLVTDVVTLSGSAGSDAPGGEASGPTAPAALADRVLATSEAIRSSMSMVHARAGQLPQREVIAGRPVRLARLGYPITRSRGPHRRLRRAPGLGGRSSAGSSRAPPSHLRRRSPSPPRSRRSGGASSSSPTAAGSSASRCCASTTC